MLKRDNSTVRGEHGASLVEMALVMFLLLMLVAGAFDLGYAYRAQIVITNASRVGARYASRFPWDEAGIIEVTTTEAAGDGLDLSAPGSIVISGGGSEAQGGDTIEVEVFSQHNTILLGSLPGMAGIGTLTLHASTEMIVFGMDDPGGS